MKEWNWCVWKDPTHHTHVWNCQRIKQNFQKLVTVNRIIIVSYKTNDVCRWGQKVPEAHWVAFSWQSWQKWWDIQRESQATSQNSDTSSHFSSRWHALGNRKHRVWVSRSSAWQLGSTVQFLSTWFKETEELMACFITEHRKTAYVLITGNPWSRVENIRDKW